MSNIKFSIEEWKPVSGFDKYKVSNMGRIMNGKGYMVRMGATSSGYLSVELSDGSGKKKNRMVHRLVAEAFIPNPENKPQVNHIDGDHLNACVDNLEWVTGEENIRHSLDSGLALLSRSVFIDDKEYDGYKENYMEEHCDHDSDNKKMIDFLRGYEEKRKIYNEARKNTLDELKRQKEEQVSLIRQKKLEANELRNTPEWHENELQEYIAKCEKEIELRRQANAKRGIELTYQEAVIDFLECKLALDAAKCEELYQQRSSSDRRGGNSFHCGDVKGYYKEKDNIVRLETLRRKAEQVREWKEKCERKDAEIKVLNAKIEELMKVREELPLIEESSKEIPFTPITTVKNKYYQPILKRPITVYTDGEPHHYLTVTDAAHAHGYKKGRDLIDDLVGKNSTLFGNYAVYDKIS